MNSYCEQSCICCSDKVIDKDCFEQCYTFSSLDSTFNSAQILWEADGVSNPSGTLALEVTAISPAAATIALFLNGEMTAVDTLDLDDSVVITSNDLDEISIAAGQDDVEVTVDLCVDVSYQCC
ncbi:S-Ena type endospore appendage [Anaeromicrobium sediminis]|uniref:Endospore appendages core domain-containing protein n=1 Tax=Anaeromicrobium sediminis TaxID=1478221 RepID=A0A267MNR1_9FIRM|nr:S-Ena type endospore appendage [Anaeromicrobium sediminis]PAB60558.1 hypothetical protein CCE28_03165 [Anaeromicrobium sediminis]